MKNTDGKKNSIAVHWIPAAAVAGITAVLLILFPGSRENFGSTASSYTMEMISIFPLVLILPGLYQAAAGTGGTQVSRLLLTIAVVPLMGLIVETLEKRESVTLRLPRNNSSDSRQE